MGRLRLTYTVEYSVAPQEYCVDTMAEAAAEELAALDQDFIGVLAGLEDSDGVVSSYTVEVVE